MTDRIRVDPGQPQPERCVASGTVCVSAQAVKCWGCGTWVVPKPGPDGCRYPEHDQSPGRRHETGEGVDHGP